MTAPRASIHSIILDSIEDGVIALDFDGRIRTFNEAASRILGIPAGGVTGRLFAETFLELEGLDQLTQTLLDTVSEKAVLGRQGVEIRVGTRRRLLTVVTSSLHAGEGASTKRIGIVAAFSDVTEAEELREAEAALARRVEAQYAELQTAYRTVEDRNEQLTAARRGARVSRVTAVVVSLVLILAAGYFVWAPDLAITTSAEPGPAPAAGGEAALTTATIEPQRLHSTIVVPGRLAPGEETSVVSPVEGVVRTLDFTYGGEVEKGRILLELDISKITRQYRSLQAQSIEAVKQLREVEGWENSVAMAAAKRAVSQARRALEKQKLEVDETAFLLGEGIIPAMEHAAAVEEYENRRVEEQVALRDLAETRKRGGADALKVARLAHRNVEEQLEEMERALAGAVVRAPAAGIATRPAGGSGTGREGGAEPLVEGKPVTRGQVLLAIVDMETLSVATVVDETEIVKLRAGQPVTVTSAAFPGLALAGEIAGVSSQAVGATTPGARGPARFEVVATIDDLSPDVRHLLRLGMSVDMTVVTRDVPDALLVPLDAVRRVRGAFEVLVRDRESGEVRAVAVETGITTLGEVEITRGLAAGDEVVLPDPETGVPIYRSPRARDAAGDDPALSDGATGLSGDEVVPPDRTTGDATPRSPRARDGADDDPALSDGATGPSG